MPSRYTYSRIVTNDVDYYEPLRNKRGVKKIVQQATPILKQPTAIQRTQMNTTRHIWKYGDRLYKLADKYYGDSRYWWVIAWWNSFPTEASITLGTPLSIPLNLEQALIVLEV
jgi:nucleoid-associated protein YgaU